MAFDSVRVKSPSTSAGIFPDGLIARYSAVRPSPRYTSTSRISGVSPTCWLTASTFRPLAESGVAYSVKDVLIDPSR